MAAQKRSAASKKAMKAVQQVGDFAKEVGVTKPKMQGKIVTGKSKQVKSK